MFSQEPRCRYSSNPLAEVICQLRFPDILSIDSNVPAEFQEAIRQDFPMYAVRKESPAPRLTGTPGNMTVENPPQSNNYQFSSTDGIWRVNLTGKFISLSCNRYTCWEDFARMLDKPLAAFIRIYRPALFSRIGLRYLNFISRQRLDLEGTAFHELITPMYLGILSDETVQEASTNRCSVDAEFSIRNGCRCKLHAGPGLVKQGGRQDPEIKFILDLDLFTDSNTAVQLSAGTLQTLHDQAYPLFRDAITDTLHDAMGPERI